MILRCLLFRFENNPKVHALMNACKEMLCKTVQFAIENKKTSMGTLSKNLYQPFRERFPNLHCKWIQNSIRAGASVVHSFKNRKKKGKAKKDMPFIERPFVYVNKEMMRWDFDGETLTIILPITPRDEDPIILTFRPHHKYKHYLDALKEGKATLGEPTLTPTSIRIPLKYPETEKYVPKEVIGVDSNERSLDWVNSRGEAGRIDISFIARTNAECDKRVRRGCKDKQNPRAKKKIQRKYGKARREKTLSLWHIFALQLIFMAMERSAAIVLENLKGMKGRLSHAPKAMRRRLLNHWSIMTFHRIVKDKAKVYGVPLIFVSATNTSKTCPVCGRIELRGQGTLECPCGLKMDRHKLAAINIACRGLKSLGIGKQFLPLLGQGVVGAPSRLLPDGVSRCGGKEASSQQEA